jgi:hypothetical protein
MWKLGASDLQAGLDYCAANGGGVPSADPGSGDDRVEPSVSPAAESPAARSAVGIGITVGIGIVRLAFALITMIL